MWEINRNGKTYYVLPVHPDSLAMFLDLLSPKQRYKIRRRGERLAAKAQEDFLTAVAEAVET